MGIGESSSYITISSMASSSKLPGSSESISTSESSVDGEEDSVGFLTGESLAGCGSSSLPGYRGLDRCHCLMR